MVPLPPVPSSFPSPVSLVVHGGDVWLVRSDSVVGLVRFRAPVSSSLLSRLESAVAAFPADWLSEVRSRWLVGGSAVPDGFLGGRLCCALCGRLLHQWESGRVYGVECVRRELPVPRVSELSAVSARRWPVSPSFPRSRPRGGRRGAPVVPVDPSLLPRSDFRSRLHGAAASRSLHSWSSPFLGRVSVLSVPSDFVHEVWSMLHRGAPFVRRGHSGLFPGSVPVPVPAPVFEDAFRVPRLNWSLLCNARHVPGVVGLP